MQGGIDWIYVLFWWSIYEIDRFGTRLIGSIVLGPPSTSHRALDVVASFTRVEIVSMNNLFFFCRVVVNGMCM
jgi:hypothetical protein